MTTMRASNMKVMLVMMRRIPLDHHDDDDYNDDGDGMTIMAAVRRPTCSVHSAGSKGVGEGINMISCGGVHKPDKQTRKSMNTPH